MMVFPVVLRELRVAARRPFTFYLRVLGATALLLACLLFGLDHEFAPTLGGRLFGYLHCTLFIAIWILVPLLTADCISAERREGTLGLLFLTPLKGGDVVVAKGLAQALRAITLWLAVVPVLTLPFLLGGVSWVDALLSIMLNSSAICWALAAGLLASAWSKTRTRVLLVAAMLCLFFVVAMGGVGGWWLSRAIKPRGFVPQTFGWSPLYVSLVGVAFLTDAGGGWQVYFLRLAGAQQMLWVAGKVFLVSLLALLAAVCAAGEKTRRVWQEEPPSAQRVALEKIFLTPVLWLSLFRRWMRRKLERNPIGWLEQRTWSGRLVTWGWLAVIVSLYSGLLTEPNLLLRGINDIQPLLGWLLAGSIALSAAGSFRRERESGVLELLLVSPLGENAIISGRLRGLWGQFLPAFVTLLAVWLYLSKLFREPASQSEIWFFATAFVSLPVVGLYFSLRCRTFLSAAVSTMVVGFVLPLLLPGALRRMWWAYINNYAPFWPSTMSAGASVLQVLAGAICWQRLHDELKRRSFPLQRTIT